MAKRKQKGQEQAIRPGLLYAGIAILVAVVAFAVVNFVFLGDGGGEPEPTPAPAAPQAPGPPPVPTEAPRYPNADEIGLFEGRDPFRPVAGALGLLAATPTPEPTPAPAAGPAVTQQTGCPQETLDEIDRRYERRKSEINSHYDQRKEEIDSEFGGRGTFHSGAREEAQRQNEEQRQADLARLEDSRNDAVQKCDPSLVWQG